jgi:16S rRNA (guanine527-N7)-methyltransferase
LRTQLEAARSLGYIGPGPVDDHVAHAEAFTDVARRLLSGVSAPKVLDLGSGGGIPGLVLAVRWPEAAVILLEGSARRAKFLRRSVAILGLTPRVAVVNDRAEQAGRRPDARGSQDLVVARAFGPPAVTAECASPFLRMGGWLVVSEPPRPTADRWPGPGLEALGLRDSGPLTSTHGFRGLEQVQPCSDRFPRRNGVPAKRPLF